MSREAHLPYLRAPLEKGDIVDLNSAKINESMDDLVQALPHALI